MNLDEFAQMCIKRAADKAEQGDRDEAIRLLELLKDEINKQIGILRS